MKNTWLVAACLLAGTVSAQPAMDAGETPPSANSASSLALWTQPLGPLALSAVYAAQDDLFMMVPVGAHVPLSATRDLVLELTPMWSRQECEARCTSQALALAVGTSWTVLPNKSGGGLFFQPKLIGVLARDERAAGLPGPFDEGSWTRTGGQLSLGLDMGYRVTRNVLFLEFVLGASVGRGWNVSTSSQSLFFAMWDWPHRRRENKWVWDFNAHLVRLGLSF